MFEFTTVHLVLLMVIILCNLLIISVQMSIMLFMMFKRQEYIGKRGDSNEIRHYNKDIAQTEKQAINDQIPKARVFQKLQVPDLDPFAIAPGLAKPPKAAGDFGSKTEIKHDS